ncbi:MAG: hypothetical protein ABIK73_08440 [candidate division WOR-3 bacterium]
MKIKMFEKSDTSFEYFGSLSTTQLYPIAKVRCVKWDLNYGRPLGDGYVKIYLIDERLLFAYRFIPAWGYSPSLGFVGVTTELTKRLQWLLKGAIEEI